MESEQSPNKKWWLGCALGAIFFMALLATFVYMTIEIYKGFHKHEEKKVEKEQTTKEKNKLGVKKIKPNFQGDFFTLYREFNEIYSEIDEKKEQFDDKAKNKLWLNSYMELLREGQQVAKQIRMLTKNVDSKRLKKFQQKEQRIEWELLRAKRAK